VEKKGNNKKGSVANLQQAMKKADKKMQKVGPYWWGFLGKGKKKKPGKPGVQEFFWKRQGGIYTHRASLRERFLSLYRSGVNEKTVGEKEILGGGGGERKSRSLYFRAGRKKYWDGGLGW